MTDHEWMKIFKLINKTRGSGLAHGSLSLAYKTLYPQKWDSMIYMGYSVLMETIRKELSLDNPDHLLAIALQVGMEPEEFRRWHEAQKEDIA